MADSSFFEEQREQSRVKTAIVKKYFGAWSGVMKGTSRRYRTDSMIAYIDLFAGPGRYSDGAKSTPLEILEAAIADDFLRQNLVTIFNDKDSSTSNSLQNAVDSIPGIETLKYKPQVRNKEVGSEIVQYFEEKKLVPTLFFVDPWGYQGLSLRLINSVVKDWGCDCIFFFNYNRISMGISNNSVRSHMEALFGVDRVELLRDKLSKETRLEPDEREAFIIEELCEAIREFATDGNRRFVLPFRFLDERGTRTSHHLIFISKHFKGYDIMKDVMGKESSSQPQGVPSFEYNPREVCARWRQGLLFELSRPLDDLEEMLLTEYAGKTILFDDLYEKHSVDRPYVKRNYREILETLEGFGKIAIDDPQKKKRRKGTMAGRLQITFPERM